MKVLIGLLLSAFSSFGAQTFVLYGLTNVTFGQAVYGSNEYHEPAFINLGSNGLDGVSIQLGEADSGIFVYPNVINDTGPGNFMAGKVYGRLNGEPDQLICSMRCHEEGDGYHPVEIDFSPLSPTLFIYQAFHRGELVAQSQPQPGFMVAYGNYFSPLYPRVNPFWRMADGSIGALIEFPDLPNDLAPNVSIPGAGDVHADRLFIRIEPTTNVVDFTSRVDITGGGGLQWFNIYDARLGVFRRAHKAFPESLLEAHGGRLTIRGTNLSAETGIAIELEDAGKFDVGFVPIAFETNAALLISGIGVGDWGPGATLGTLSIMRQGDSLTLTATLDVTTNIECVVYRQGVEVARQNGLSAAVPAMVRVLGCGLQARSFDTPPGFSVRLEQVVAITVASQVHDGDEVRFLAADSAIFFALETVTLTAPGLGFFTIVREESQPPARPRLAIARAIGAVVLSWIDPNHIFRLESASSAAGPFYGMGIGTEYVGDSTSVSLEVDPNRAIFYRLSTDPAAPPQEDELLARAATAFDGARHK